MNTPLSAKLTALTCLAFSILLPSCSGIYGRGNSVVISVKDQQMLLLQDGVPVKKYPVSTSKFGLGSEPGSMKTPLGKMKVAKKIGEGAPEGAVFKSRKLTGEILKPNSPGRDPIVTRILWLHGQEKQNRNTFARYIYIHGTPEERYIGYPVSYGCIRMKSSDVKDLYQHIAEGSEVTIINKSLQPIPKPAEIASRLFTFRRNPQADT